MKQRELGISIGIQNFLIANLCYYASLLAHLLYMALCLCRSPAYLPGPWPLTPCGRAHCTGGQHGSAQRRAPERPAACRDGAVSPPAAQRPRAAWPPGRVPRRCDPLPVLAVAGRSSRFRPAPPADLGFHHERGTVNGREREGLGSEQAGGRGSLLWAVIRVPKLVVYGLDHLFGLNLSSGIYLMYVLIVNIVCIYVLWMYILIHFQKIVGYSWEYPGIQLPPPMAARSSSSSGHRPPSTSPSRNPIWGCVGCGGYRRLGWTRKETIQMGRPGCWFVGFL